MLLAILVNCLFMALNPPFPRLEQDSELVFITIFTAELLLKVVAFGFCMHRGAYLRSTLWNWLDFTVVLTGLVSVGLAAAAADGGGQIEGISALRAARVLRPLRTISRVPGMRVLVRALIDALPPLGGVLLLFVFFLLVFGIVGVQLFSDTLHSRCYEPLEPALSSLPLDAALCSAAAAAAAASCVERLAPFELPSVAASAPPVPGSRSCAP